ncbi:MAG: enoyl-CoA hydratase/isomerase family protein [Sphingomonadales bacterium]|nr:enoyl-CoA hydratase/isomerase family protein [Sphingomonadales bacterium]
MSAVRYETADEVAILTVDNPPVNALSLAVREGLHAGVDRARDDAAVKALVILCGGSTFIAGADITEFGTPKATTEPRVRGLIAKIEDSAKPVIAAIHGTALGGGLEVAMGCHWRIAAPDAKVGLPEVSIGLLPGAGGTVRTPRLVGPALALEMCTSGKHYDAAFALEAGLIDGLVDGDLRTGALAFARQVVAENRPLRVTSRMNDKVTGVDPQLFVDFRKKLGKKIRGQLAPEMNIRCVEKACSAGFEEAYAFEADAFQQCMQGPQRAALIRLFRAEREARKIPGLGDAKPVPLRKVAVVGSGTMGGGIAMCFANAGIPVSLIDVSGETLDRGMARARGNYATSVSRGSMSQEEMDRALALIAPSTELAAASDADIVIEAVFEDMALKQQLFAELDAIAPPQAILASNTSSLNIDEMANATRRPDKVIGTHFFSPANVMKLLENVRGTQSSPETIATVMALGRTIGKVTVLAGNCDGFIGNRMFQFYNNAWEYLLEEGASPEQIDRAALDFGMAMGPAAVRDLAGLDVACLVRQARAPTIPKEERISPIIERLVAMGRHGQKTGAGLYRYEGRNPVPDPEVRAVVEQVAAEFGIRRREVREDEIMPRMLYPLINEGAKILEEGIALRAGDIDVAYCHGYGFPKHLGGPMYWGEQQGLGRIAVMMEELSQRFGPRYRPAPLLVKLAEEGKGWP